jgi:hypothetical protein
MTHSQDFPVYKYIAKGESNLLRTKNAKTVQFFLQIYPNVIDRYIFLKKNLCNLTSIQAYTTIFF